jgi:leucyl-tRNA synthetase
VVNSGLFNGLHSDEAKKKVCDYLEEKKIGKASVNFRLRDWGVSRQRYWGTPIPIIRCDECGLVPVPEDQLPIQLPLDVDLGNRGQSPLTTLAEFYKTNALNVGGWHEGKRTRWIPLYVLRGILTDIHLQIIISLHSIETI